MIKHVMINGNTISFNVLKKRSPGYEIRVIVSLFNFNGLSVNPEMKMYIERRVNFAYIRSLINT